MCAWNNHYCWPGNCGADGLTKDCTCAANFSKVSLPDPYINSGNTTCQPTQTPTILTCDTVAIGPNGEKKRAMSSAASTACENLQDMYGNFQPSVMEFHVASDFTINVSSITKPAFIVESNFGISDSTIRINKLTVDGMYRFFYSKIISLILSFSFLKTVIVNAIFLTVFAQLIR